MEFASGLNKGDTSINLPSQHLFLSYLGYEHQENHDNLTVGKGKMQLKCNSSPSRLDESGARNDTVGSTASVSTTEDAFSTAQWCSLFRRG